MDTTFRRGGHLPPGGGRGDSPFGRQYGIAVLLMVVGIFAGSRVLSAVLEMPEAVPAWVLFVVGLHFLPFVKLFGSKRFLVLGGGLCAVAVLAVILGNGGAAWAWQAIPGFGGAVVLWSIVAVGLYSTQSEMSRR